MMITVVTCDGEGDQTADASAAPESEARQNDVRNERLGMRRDGSRPLLDGTDNPHLLRLLAGGYRRYWRWWWRW